MMTDALTEFAKLFKDRDHKPVKMPTTGFVKSVPPNPKIRLTDNIILDKSHLIFCNRTALSYDVGDEVVLVPQHRNMYIVLDRAVRY
ncbi:hypothetical protein JOD17_000185 [Geomicrobium sediminis]|uniref:DUF2577 domain-containing protein n=1 Tax=Geomicrobium sediminis TaxID=1347788 RepID=A0ABS2P718_9BACL|nr:hypothetical protein [Geomicrobium sediminis]